MTSRICLSLTLLITGLCCDLYSQGDQRIALIVRTISADSIEASVRKLASFGTRHTLSDTVSNLRGIGAARRWIHSRFLEYAKLARGRMTVHDDRSIARPSARIPYPVEIVNVVATLHGSSDDSDRQRVIIVSGHYDSRASNAMDSTSDAPGANDDASGTAVVLELARVLAAHEFDATIRFVSFAGEEQGLLGATAMAESSIARRVNIEALLNNDIIGNSHGGNGREERTYVRVFSEAFTALDTGAAFQERNRLGLENDGLSRSLARYVKEVGESYVPSFQVRMVFRRDRFLRGGDQTPFHQRGFASVRLSEASEDFRHQHQDVKDSGGTRYGDLPEFMDFNYCADIARVNVATVASLASAPRPPVDAGIMTARLEYDTELRWRRNAEADVAGYRVRYRLTTSPSWEQTVFTSDTSITLKVLKDDYIFGVQAVDNVGNPSLVSVARPLRNR